MKTLRQKPKAKLEKIAVAEMEWNGVGERFVIHASYSKGVTRSKLGFVFLFFPVDFLFLSFLSL